MRSLLHANSSIAHLGGRWLALDMNKVARALACVIDNVVYGAADGSTC